MIKRRKNKTVKNIVVTINIKRQEKRASDRCFVVVVVITSANVNVVLGALTTLLLPSNWIVVIGLRLLVVTLVFLSLQTRETYSLM